MPAEPLVSILMPVYNAEPFVRMAVESILKQTYRRFELIIVDDGSSDNSVSIINSFNDDRIHLIRNGRNLGLNYSLRAAMDSAKGKYFARADADDISFAERLSKQIAFLENNKNCCLVGAWAQAMDSEGNQTGTLFRTHTADSTLKASLFFSCPFLHPSIVLRSSVLYAYSVRYSTEVAQAEDYVLYSDLLICGDFANLAEPLIYYRVHNSSSRITSERNNRAIIHGRMVAWRKLLSHLALNVTDDLLFLHDKLSYYPERLTKSEALLFPEYVEFLISLRSANYRLEIFDKHLFAAEVANRIYSSLLHPLFFSTKAFRWYYRCYNLLSVAQRFKFPVSKFKRLITS